MPVGHKYKKLIDYSINRKWQNKPQGVRGIFFTYLYSNLLPLQTFFTMPFSVVLLAYVCQSNTIREKTLSGAFQFTQTSYVKCVFIFIKIKRTLTIKCILLLFTFISCLRIILKIVRKAA